MPNPYDALRDASSAMAAALRDNGHDENETDAHECPGCAALADYVSIMQAFVR
jgi:hypothetical protein